jgi:uncharacterized protein (TIGR03437 family)
MPSVDRGAIPGRGDRKTPAKTMAAPGFTGMDLTQFEVPTGLSKSPVAVLVSINGEESNTVMLPVK